MLLCSGILPIFPCPPAVLGPLSEHCQSQPAWSPIPPPFSTPSPEQSILLFSVFICAWPISWFPPPLPADPSPLLWICRLWFLSFSLGDVTAFGMVLSMKKPYPELKNLTWLPKQQPWIAERISFSIGFAFMAVTDYLCSWHFSPCRFEHWAEKTKD